MTWIHVLLVVLLVAVLVGAWILERRRRDEFRKWAREQGWRYRHQWDGAIRRRWGFLDKMQVGHSRKGCHLLEGSWGDHDAAAFQFRYKTGSGKNQSTHWFSVVLIEIEEFFPELRVYPESMLGKMGQMLGFDDIDLESIEFSKAFTVRSQDKKLAYDFCNTRMMEYLLQHRDTAIELEGRTLALFRDRRIRAGDLEPLLDRLTGLRGRMPGYLFRD